MASSGSGRTPCVIVVGDPCSEFVRTMVRLAKEYEVEAVQCDDVYSAVAATARTTGRPALIVGAMRDLAREGSRFFQIAETNALRCCCLVDRGLALGSGGMLAAVKAGASLIDDTQGVKPILKEWLSSGERSVEPLSLRDLMDDDLRATEAELSALLGQGTDV